jgi:hypothetical protein
MSGLFHFPVSSGGSPPIQESIMQSKPVLQYSTVPSFRRRLRRVLRALERLVAPRARIDIPDYLRKDIGLPHGGPRPRANAPPEGNPLWRI